MCNEVSITCSNSGLKNAHLQLVHGSTLRLFLLLVPGGCSVTACKLLSIMRIRRHGQLLASPEYCEQGAKSRRVVEKARTGSPRKIALSYARSSA
jgi:hypothetical protein